MSIDFCLIKDNLGIRFNRVWRIWLIFSSVLEDGLLDFISFCWESMSLESYSPQFSTEAARQKYVFYWELLWISSIFSGNTPSKKTCMCRAAPKIRAYSKSSWPLMYVFHARCSFVKQREIQVNRKSNKTQPKVNKQTFRVKSRNLYYQTKWIEWAPKINQDNHI